MMAIDLVSDSLLSSSRQGIPLEYLASFLADNAGLYPLLEG